MPSVKQLLKPIVIDLIDRVIESNRSFVLKQFKKHYPDQVVPSRDMFRWEDLDFQKAEVFDDLLPLFHLGQQNRGLLRQEFDEAALLYRVVSQMQTPYGVEIGRLKGGSTLLLASAVGQGGKIISIDIAPLEDTPLRRVLEQLGLMDRVELITGDANLVTVEGSLDFVFIDGDHSYEGARKDHDRWTPRLKPGGIAIYHDMALARKNASQWSSLRKLRQEILDTQEDQFELVEEKGSMSVFRRKNGSENQTS